MNTVKPMKLHRITTEYVGDEDRLRLSGEDAQGQTRLLWLTHRLVDRLIAHLTSPLESQVGASPQADLIQVFSQQKARVELATQPALRPDPEGGAALVHSVDVTVARFVTTLHFKTRNGAAVASLGLAPRPRRQWLSILHDLYEQAGWSTAAFPAWLLEARYTAARPASASIH